MSSTPHQLCGRRVSILLQSPDEQWQAFEKSPTLWRATVGRVGQRLYSTVIFPNNIVEVKVKCSPPNLNHKRVSKWDFGLYFVWLEYCLHLPASQASKWLRRVTTKTRPGGLARTCRTWWCRRQPQPQRQQRWALVSNSFSKANTKHAHSCESPSWPFQEAQVREGGGHAGSPRDAFKLDEHCLRHVEIPAINAIFSDWTFAVRLKSIWQRAYTAKIFMLGSRSYLINAAFNNLGSSRAKSLLISEKRHQADFALNETCFTCWLWWRHAKFEILEQSGQKLGSYGLPRILVSLAKGGVTTFLRSEYIWRLVSLLTFKFDLESYLVDLQIWNPCRNSLFTDISFVEMDSAVLDGRAQRKAATPPFGQTNSNSAGRRSQSPAPTDVKFEF